MGFYTIEINLVYKIKTDWITFDINLSLSQAMFKHRLATALIKYHFLLLFYLILVHLSPTQSQTQHNLTEAGLGQRPKLLIPHFFSPWNYNLTL